MERKTSFCKKKNQRRNFKKHRKMEEVSKCEEEEEEESGKRKGKKRMHEETLAASSLHPKAAPGDPMSKLGAMHGVMNVMAGMGKSDLIDFFNQVQAQFGPGKTYGVGDNSAHNSSAIDMKPSHANGGTTGPKTADAMPRLNVKEDIEEMFNGQDLTEKFKENITPLNKGLEIVNKLKPVTFNFISDTENNFSEYEEVGFIAQDVDRALSTETFAKSIVKAADDSEPTSTMGLATLNLIPILVKAIQEQQALIKALEQRIINLENK